MPTEPRARLTSLRLQNMRSFVDATLDFQHNGCGLTVLIGANGSGKSTVIEALDIISKTADTGNVSKTADTGNVEARFAAATRRGPGAVQAPCPTLDVDTIDADRAFGWHMGPDTVPRGKKPGLQPRRLGPRDPSPTDDAPKPDPELNLSDPVVERSLRALTGVEIQPPMAVRPQWQRNAGASGRISPRDPCVLRKVDRIGRYGEDMVLCYYAMRDRRDPGRPRLGGSAMWEEVLDLVRDGLFPDLIDIELPLVNDGQISMDLVLGEPEYKINVSELSDGQVSFLAWVAAIEMNPERSLLAIDEPELHLHPHLIGRLVWLLERAAERHPVVVATHSDHLLDALSNPADSVVLCHYDREKGTQFLRPDPEGLKAWLKEYRGMGALRAEGYDRLVFHHRIAHETDPDRDNGRQADTPALTTPAARPTRSRARRTPKTGAV